MNSKKKVLIAVVVAFILWTLMFSPWTAPHIPFWHAMTCSAIILTALAFLLGGNPFTAATGNLTNKDLLVNIGLGILIAVVLWGVFWVGDKLSQWMFPNFARAQVNTIYAMKEGSSPVALSLLLLLIVGPAEELFWRGYVQRSMMEEFRFQKLDVRIQKKYQLSIINYQLRTLLPALAAVLIYALIHIASLNFMLIMSALVCGLVWGGLYWLFPHRLPAIVISHALWDAAVFVWFPIS